MTFSIKKEVAVGSKSKNEQVSISFHHLIRDEKDGEHTKNVPFTLDEFRDLYDRLAEHKAQPLSDTETTDKIKYRHLAAIRELESFDERYIAGVYQAGYWGHAYDNSKHGKITAESLNLRPFFFLLYLSDTGKIYVASQYLGHFGGYVALRNTIITSLRNRRGVSARSFNVGGINLDKAIPKQLNVVVSKKGKNISHDNSFSKNVAVAFRRQPDDDKFGEEVERQLLSNIDEPPEKIIKNLVDIIKSNNLMDIDDADIEDCNVVVQINGKTRTIHLLDGNNYATKFPLDVPINQDGHPIYNPIKGETISLLKNEIINRKESV